MKISRHPDYSIVEWNKWRSAYAGGRDFINTYLKRLSLRETEQDFIDRKDLTYCPSFAKLGVNEVRDSIYNRMSDIAREGGSESYTDACKGLDSGVDLFGSSMNYFMGCKVLPELLTMQKVGIYVDMPPLRGPSLVDNQGLRPYIYMFRVEDICNWVMDESDDPNEFSSVLLHESVYTYDEETGFPTGTAERYRRLWKDPTGQVMVGFYDENGEPLEEEMPLNINKIPFIMLDIGESLMTDVADYQIALLNLASTDMAYAVKANFPFYTEQVDPRSDNPNLRTGQGPQPGQTPQAGKPKEVTVGVTKGRSYPIGADRPDFIHPSPEPLKVSMEKQEQLKSEIRLLLKLTITNLAPPKMASAESKKQDTRSLENGLSYIGLTLENAERKIAEFWKMYEGIGDIANVNYPVDYTLNNEEDRRKEAEYLEDVKKNVCSLTYQKVVQKRLAKISMGNKLSEKVVKEIEQEIDDSKVLITDPEILIELNGQGICSAELASEALGFPKGDYEKAQVEHAERLKRIAISQSQGAAAGAQGGDNADSGAAKDQKTLSQDRNTAKVNKPRVRGSA